MIVSYQYIKKDLFHFFASNVIDLTSSRSSVESFPNLGLLLVCGEHLCVSVVLDVCDGCVGKIPPKGSCWVKGCVHLKFG